MEDFPIPAPGLQPGLQPANNLAALMNAVIPYFGDGQDTLSANNWLSLFNKNADLYYWSDDIKIRVARIKMTGPAFVWNCGIPSQASWNQFSSEFLARFGECRESALMRLAKCRQMKGESVASYSDRFRRDANLAGRVEDDSLLFQFREGLQWRLKDEVHRARDRIQTLSDIMEYAKYWEDYYTLRGEDTSNQGLGYMGASNNNNYGPFPRNDNQRPDYRGSPVDRPYQARGNPFNEDANRGRYYGPVQPNSYIPRQDTYRPANRNPGFGTGGGGGAGPAQPNQNPRPYAQANGALRSGNNYRPAGEKNPATAAPSAQEALEDLSKKFERLQLSHAQALQELHRRKPWGPNNMSFFQPCPEESDYRDDINSGQYSPNFEQGQYEMECSFDQGHQFEEEAQSEVPAYDDISHDAGAPSVGIGPYCLYSQEDDPCNQDTSESEDSSDGPSFCMMNFRPDAKDIQSMRKEDSAVSAQTYDAYRQQRIYNRTPAIYTNRRAAADLPPRRAPVNGVAFGQTNFGTSGSDPAKGTPIKPGRSHQQNPKPASQPGPNRPRGPHRQTAPAKSSALGKPQQDNCHNAVPHPVPSQKSPGPWRKTVPSPSRIIPLEPPGTYQGSTEVVVPSKRPQQAVALLVPDLPADAKANSKGRQKAWKTGGNTRKANLSQPAAKKGVASSTQHNQNLEEKDKETARRADKIINRQVTAQIPAATAPAAPANLYNTTPIVDSKKMERRDPDTSALSMEDTSELLHTATALEDLKAPEAPTSTTRYGLCQTTITLSIPGQSYGDEVEAILDTGACECGVSYDTVMKLKAIDYMDTSKQQSFTTAAGQTHKALGKINLAVTIEPLTTIVRFNVTEALHYQILLGNEFLLAIGATIKLPAKQMMFAVRPGFKATVPFVMYSDDTRKTNTIRTITAMPDDVDETFWSTYDDNPTELDTTMDSAMEDTLAGGHVPLSDMNASDEREASWSAYAPTQDARSTELKQKDDCAGHMATGDVYQLFNGPGSETPKHVRNEGHIQKTLLREETVCPSIPEGSPCEICRSPDNLATMIICSTCAEGYHCGCLPPALPSIPKGAWDCASCRKKGKQSLYPWRCPSENNKEDVPATPATARPDSQDDEVSAPRRLTEIPVEIQGTLQGEDNSQGLYKDEATLHYLTTGTYLTSRPPTEPGTMQNELRRIMKCASAYEMVGTSVYVKTTPTTRKLRLPSPERSGIG